MWEAILKLLKFSQETETNPKKSVPIILSLLLTVASIIVFSNNHWVINFKTNYGWEGLIVILVLEAITLYYFFDLIFHGIYNLYAERKKRQTEQIRSNQALEEMYQTASHLTKDQKKIVTKMIRNGKLCIDAFEIGEYEVIWKAEVDGLIKKKILRYMGHERYEMTESYYQFFLANIDFNNEILRHPTQTDTV